MYKILMLMEWVLKKKLSQLSWRLRFWNVSFLCTTVTSQHSWTPFTLMCFLHGWNILMKTFTILVTDFPEIFEEKVQMGTEKINFQLHVISWSLLKLLSFTPILIPNEFSTTLLKHERVYLVNSTFVQRSSFYYFCQSYIRSWCLVSLIF